MDILRSPWRYDYVSSATEPRACILCLESNTSIGQNDDNELRDAERLVLVRAHHNFVIMNLYPYTSGHLMVAPYRHVGDLSETEPNELAEMMSLAEKCTRVLKQAYRPEGFNIGMNIGECAGAGVRHHIHLHVVPRWCGDVNFMTATSETRVLPEDIQDGYRRLRPLFES